MKPLCFLTTLVKEIEQHKHLGVVFNSALSWKDHVATISLSVSKLLDVMHKLSKDIDRKSLETIYESFIRSKLEYACIVWDDCSEQDHIALEKCQLRAARIVTGAKKGTSHDKLYTEIQWPKLHERREKFKLCFMHKVVNKSAPNYLVEILSNAVNVNKHYKLRNEDDIEQFQFRTEKFRKSLFPDCVRKWNSLEKDLRKECSFNAFRTKVITNTVANCSKLYYVGQRKFNIILAQLRMNCSNLNAHLYSLHVIDSPACGCSHRVEDTAHFFLDCPLYYAQRLSLRNTVTRSSQFRLETILYGDDDLDYESNVAIILAVHEFIKDSERF